MSSTLEDILILLDTVKSFMLKDAATRQYVKKTFNEQPIRKARISHYDEVEKLCNVLELLNIKTDKVTITSLGKKIIEHDLVESDLKMMFINDVVFGPNLKKWMHEALLKFDIDEDGLFSYPKEKIYELFELPIILPILYEIGLLEKKETKIIINPKYASLVHKVIRITQKQLEEQITRQKIIGDIGEEIALKLENSRLEESGLIRQADLVRSISAEFANAGYDIESFDKTEQGDIRRIYIEVKSSVGISIDFYWSANEIKKAQEHGNDYWIYFVPGIDIQSRTSEKPIIIKNPYQKIFVERLFNAKSDKYHITND